MVDGGWLVPGLVDVHTHPGAERPGHPSDESLLRQHLADHASAGVLLIRAPGSAALIRAGPTTPSVPGQPRLRSAGPWLATPGRFFPGWGRHVTEADLAAAAVQEAAAALETAQDAAAARETAQDAAQLARGPRTGPASPASCLATPAAPSPAAAPAVPPPPGTAGPHHPHGRRVQDIGDWAWDEPPVPLAVLREVTSAVHAIGGKVSVHAQTAAGCANAVAAGVDSLEHGMHLDPGLLDQMAARGTALVPTLSAFAASAFGVRAGDPGPRRDSYLAGWAAMPPTARAAYEAGVTVLAGDLHGHAPERDSGRGSGAADERLPSLEGRGGRGRARTARDWLGLPGWTDGAPADLVVFDEDPVAHPDVLHHPRRIILRGQILA